MKLIRQRRGTHDGMHPADAIQLEDLASRGELQMQRRWMHHMYFGDEASAREACRQILAAGWNQEWLSEQPAPYPGWVLRAGRDVVISQDAVNEAREFFDSVCDATGGTYAGWDVRPIPRHALN